MPNANDRHNWRFDTSNQNMEASKVRCIEAQINHTCNFLDCSLVKIM